MGHLLERLCKQEFFQLTPKCVKCTGWITQTICQRIPDWRGCDTESGMQAVINPCVLLVASATEITDDDNGGLDWSRGLWLDTRQRGGWESNPRPLDRTTDTTTVWTIKALGSHSFTEKNPGLFRDNFQDSIKNFPGPFWSPQMFKYLKTSLTYNIYSQIHCWKFSWWRNSSTSTQTGRHYCWLCAI